MKHGWLILLFACGQTDPELAPAEGSDDEWAIEGAQSLDLQAERGRDTIMHGPEACILPNHIAGAKVDAKDLEAEESLCAIDFYDKVAICPKVVSTNPGIDVEKPDTLSKADFEAQECLKSDRASKTLAKFKQSITCSYTPSILGYYHLSRALGGLGGVKPAVLRTMQVQEHKKITAQGLRSALKQFWRIWQSSEATPAQSKYKQTLYTNDYTQIYGALQENMRGEVKYSPINVRSVSGDISVAFRNSMAWREVTDAHALTIPRTLDAAAQRITRMGDIADMVVIDTLMNQQDRYGNIHAIDYYYALSSDGEIEKVKKKDVDSGDETMPAGAVSVREMRLKDNDCGGPSKGNVAKAARMADALRHMRPTTYAHFRWLRTQLEDPDSDVIATLVKEATFSETDVKMLKDNATYVWNALDANCRSGALKLDLDLVAYLRGETPVNDCDALAPPIPSVDPELPPVF